MAQEASSGEDAGGRIASPRARARIRLPQAAGQGGHAWSRALLAGIEESFEHRRLFLLAPFSAMAGLIAYAGLSGEPAPWMLAVLGIVAVAGLVGARIFERGQRAAVLAAGFWAGLCLLPIHGWLWGTPMLAFPAYGAYQAVVDEVLSETETQRRVIISQIAPQEGARAVPIRRARILVPAEGALAPGDLFAANLRLAPVPGPILPGAHDAQFHGFFAGIGAYGNVTSGFRVLATDESLNPVRAVDGTRRAIAYRLDAHLDPDSASIARAMVVGDQSEISDETRRVMALSGLAHIYSISGLHLSIVAGGVFFLVRAGLAAAAAFGGRVPARKIAAVAGIVSACGYLLLAGGMANVPAFRSTLMLVLIFGAVLAGRRALTMRNVALAAMVILLIDPATIFRPSFQLSFAAVVALIGIYEMPRRFTLAERGVPGWLTNIVWGTALTSLIAGAATLLFSAYHFQQTAPLGVLANVMVIPVVTLIMGAGAVSVLLMPVGLEAPFVHLLGWGIDRMLDVAVIVTGWSEGLEPNPLLTPVALLIGLAGLAWFAFLRGRLKFLGPAVAVPLVFLLGFDQRPDVLVADSTQAVAIREGEGMGLLAGRTRSFAVDVWSDTYDRVIAPRLEAARCDGQGCVWTNGAYSIALVRTRDGFPEDCARNDLVVTRLTAPADCRNTAQVIDTRDLARGGVHWLRWDPASASFEIRRAIPEARRPWRIPRR